MLNKYNALGQSDFGNGTAELERMLQAAFVETPLWEDLLSGKRDVIYGVKGAGKSALYAHLFNNAEVLKRKGIILIGAENVQDDPVFQNLSGELEMREELFVGLWKLYFLSLIGRQFQLMSSADPTALNVIHTLQNEGLLIAGEEPWLTKTFKAVQKYVRIEFAGQLGLPLPFPAQLTGKITLREPSQEQSEEEGKISIHHLFQNCAKALMRAKKSVWIVVDRLDVAFSSNPDLEAKALSSLFQAYSDLSVPVYKSAISIKIFLRSDIWDRISGRRTGDSIRIANASAIVGATIQWGDSALMALLMRRILANDSLRDLYKVHHHFGIKLAKVWSNYESQQALFYRIFPTYLKIPVQHGDTPALVRTFDWMLNETRDGTGQIAPRNLIVLLTYARDIQRERLSRGAAKLAGELLFDEYTLLQATTMVSDFHLFQTIYNEYPHLRPFAEKLRGTECEHPLTNLADIWAVPLKEAQRRVDELTYIGVFEKRHSAGTASYYIPPLFQHALALLPE